MSEHQGMMVVGLGLPGCGKSSVFRELGKRLQCQAFLEPEENEWSLAVTERASSDYFSCITWFRSMRVPQLYLAAKARDEGEIALVDSYYDKAMHYCLGKEGMEWLIPPEDHYYALVKEMMKRDLETLPVADCVISFEVEFQDWLALLQARNRAFDQQHQLHKTYQTQHYYLNAAERLAKEQGCRHLRFKQKLSSPQAAAMELESLLYQMDIVRKNVCTQY